MKGFKPLRGTKAEHDQYVGEEGELTAIVDTTNNIYDLAVHDGATSGGHRQFGGHVCRVRHSSTVTVAADTEVQVPYDTISFDTGGQWDTSNHEFTAAVDGIYQAEAFVTFQNVEDGAKHQLRIRKNGSVETTMRVTPGSTATTSLEATDAFELTQGDTIDFSVKQYASVSNDLKASAFDNHAIVRQIR